MKNRFISNFVPSLLYIGINAVFLAYFNDQKVMEYYQRIENQYNSSYDYDYKYTTYLKLSQGGSSLMMATFILIILLEHNYKKLFAYLILCINLIGVLLIIIGMIIGSQFLINFQQIIWYNEIIAFGFGQIALYLIGCIKVSLIISGNKSQIPQQYQIRQLQQIPQQQVQQFDQKIDQQIPIGLPIPQYEIELKQQS